MSNQLNKNNENDDDSFIILGSSPSTSLSKKIKDTDTNGEVQVNNLNDALTDLSDETNMAFKAHFKLGKCPSPASMTVASSIVSDHSSTEHLLKKFGEIIDENVILKETLKQNNDSIKEQFLLIASCQEDMLKTQQMHREKFEETKQLVAKLRSDNQKLKQELQQKVEAEVQTTDSLSSKSSGPSSGLEFVTSPDDDTINKLTAQLELIERQRRQVLVDNEKLTWQKESLEHIVDATSKERDELKDKVHLLELQLLSKESEYLLETHGMKSMIQDMKFKIDTDDSEDRYTHTINELNTKVNNLQEELKEARLKIFSLENIRLEFTNYKSNSSETVKVYKEQIQDLNNRLKEAQTTVFQPVRVSLGAESSSPPSLTSNVRLYDKTLQHLSQLLNSLTNGLLDTMVETMGVVTSLQESKIQPSTADHVKTCMGDLRRTLEKQHSSSLRHIGEVKGTLSIFEGIFKEYNDLLKKSVVKQNVQPPNPNVEALTNALIARGQEINNLEERIRVMQEDNVGTGVLLAQLELYKGDFEAERKAREKMASEKENILTDLRSANKRLTELSTQMDEVKKLNPGVYWSVTMKPKPQATSSTRPNASFSNTSIIKVFTCPKCRRFKTTVYAAMNEHLDFCPDANDPCFPF